MTLVVTVNTHESLWVLVDRRLSIDSHAKSDDACKLMRLKTVDGNAILAYAGLGATAKGTQPADWMSNVLRGRSLTLEQSLVVLADVMKAELPRHLLQIPGKNGPSHNVVVPAFVGKEHRVYTINFGLTADRKTLLSQLTRHVVNRTTHSPPIVAAGRRGFCFLA